MTGEELIALIERCGGRRYEVAQHTSGSPLYTPLTPNNLVLLENVKTRFGCTLWNDGNGAFPLRERYNVLMQQRGWKILE